jgi:hypothetical protein
MLALRNAQEAKQIDSLKRVMKNSKRLAKASISKSNEAKKLNPELVETGKELDPYLARYKKYKSKLALDCIDPLLSGQKILFNLDPIWRERPPA